MRTLEGLKPENVFRFFEDICAIPHGSGNTFAISQYCVDFAVSRGLDVIRDSLNNVIIKKPASSGYENHESVIIQGHLDMVCEKLPNIDIDFEKDGLTLNVKDGYVCAEGTTLGGDDGIAIAMALAVLDDDSLCHPPVVAVFTVDEETGMYGAQGIDLSGIDAKLLLNIDSEEESVLTVSCAGGLRVNANIPLTSIPSSDNCFKILLSGLTGGHSGVEIHCGRLNANKTMAQLLNEMSSEYEIFIHSLKGGTKDNAITRECEVIICCKADYQEISSFCNDFLKTLPLENDKTAEFKIDNYKVDYVCDKDSTLRIIGFLNDVPNGVVKMSDEIEGLVQTSLNLGVLNVNTKILSANFSLRSSVNSEKYELAENLRAIAQKYCGGTLIDSEYPAWEYKKKSRLREAMIDVHKRVYGKEPIVMAIHAGLECGMFADKIEGLDAVSFGPDILDIHTPSERLDIDSVDRTYNYLIEVLKQL